MASKVLVNLNFNWNPTEASAGNVVLDNGGYVFDIVNAKPLLGKNKETNVIENFGIMLHLKVLTEGKFMGKMIFVKLFYHTPACFDMNKNFYCNAYGFDSRVPGKEDAFDAFAQSLDWAAKWDEEIVGEGYTGVKGRSVGATVTKKTDPEYGEQNNFRWHPVG